jgi:hypothetical protein
MGRQKRLPAQVTEAKAKYTLRDALFCVGTKANETGNIEAIGVRRFGLKLLRWRAVGLMAAMHEVL